MNFWNKNGKKSEEELNSTDSSNLFDVSNFDIPESDKNDQYNLEGPTDEKPTPYSTFSASMPKAPNMAKTPSGASSHFMAPPIPRQKAPSYENTTTDMPSLSPEEEAFFNDLPPLPDNDMSFNELPPLPPVTQNDTTVFDDLPPLPMSENDKSPLFDDLPPIDSVSEFEATNSDEKYNFTETPKFPDENEDFSFVEKEPDFETEFEDEDDSAYDDFAFDESQVIGTPDSEIPAPEKEDQEEYFDEDTYFDDDEDSDSEETFEDDIEEFEDEEVNDEPTADDDQITEPIKQDEIKQQAPKNKQQDVPFPPVAQAPRSKTFEKKEEPENEEKEKEKTQQVSETSNENQDLLKSEDPNTIHYTHPLFLQKLFANGNTCITAPGATFQLKDDLRSLLALFSNGRYFVAETYKYDGKVLSFEYLVKKRHLQIGKPEYVPMNVLSTIYEYAAQNTYVEDADEINEKPDVVEQAQARMQRDFITIISRAAAMHVSDIHIVVAENTIVMFRVNGLMQTEMEYKKEWGESFVRAAFASADISDANYAQNEYQAAQKLGRTPLRGSHGKLVLPRNILGIRLQFNPIAFGTRYVVLRLLYAEENIETNSALEALGFTKKDTDDFYKLRGMPTGITIISGPTGSGKSTTLQRNMIAMLQERNYEVNLITVEDPPEYPIPGARQMPVTNATIEEAKEREFTKALAAALRSDPDSMMIGEVRTLSAADLAFRAALSGHNVWTTLHANNAPSILIRLKDMGVEEFKLKDPEIMKGLTAQRLFRRLCPHCRIATTQALNSPVVQRLRLGFGDVALENTYLRGHGCKQCDFKGVKGRIAVSEIILPDATFLDLMIKGETVKATNYWINELNGTTLRESALRHMFNGIIDVGEVERWTGFLDQTITA